MVPLSVLYEALQVSSSLKKWREIYPMSANTCSSAPCHLVLTVEVGGDIMRAAVSGGFCAVWTDSGKANYTWGHTGQLLSFLFMKV